MRLWVCSLRALRASDVACCAHSFLNFLFSDEDARLTRTAAQVTPEASEEPSLTNAVKLQGESDMMV